MEHKDYLNKKLNIGDKVILIEPAYRNFIKGVVYKFTEHFVFIKRHDKAGINGEIKQKGYQLIKY